MTPEAIGTAVGVFTFLALLAGVVFKQGYNQRRLEQTEDDRKEERLRVNRHDSDIKDLLQFRAKLEGREEGRRDERQQSSHDLDKYRRE